MSGNRAGGRAARAARVAVKVGLVLCALWAVFALAVRLAPLAPLARGGDMSVAVHAADGTLLRVSLASDGHYRLPVGLDRVSPWAIEAALFHEDRRFYDHGGVDLKAVARAAYATFVRGGRREGASTVTMQVARMRYDLHTRSVWGKLRQMWTALKIEARYDKAAILQAYFQLLPYGANVDGIESAALVYFGKPAAELSRAEAYALTVIPQSPARRDPHVQRGDAKDAGALARAVTALRARAGLPAAPLPRFQGVGALPFLAPHFVDAVLNTARVDPAQFEDLATGHVRTALRPALQRQVEDLLTAHMARRVETGTSNAAVLVAHVPTGAVLAHVGSVDYLDVAADGQVDGTRARRSPGSALKPFIYGLAADQGLIHPASMLEDLPKRFGAFNPENFDNQFQGPITARSALVRSRNVPAVHLLDAVGRDTLHALLAKARLGGLRGPDHYGLAAALGGVEVTAYELAALYMALANGGAWHPLRTAHAALRVPVTTGAQPEADPAHQLLTPAASALVLHMLESHARPGTGFSASWLKHALPVAWKTGTSSGLRDAWTAGVAGEYVVVTWLGHFDGHGDPSLIGVRAASPLFFDVIDALKDTTSRQVRPGDIELTQQRVCAVSGKLPGPFCAHTKTTAFIPGRSPIHRCDVHQRITVRKATGLRTCPEASAAGGPTEDRVVEAWPSHLARLFRRAGLGRPPLPPFEPGCDGARIARGKAPQIVSPTPGMQVRLQPQNPRPIPLDAVVAADAAYVDWFADAAYIGRATRGEVLLHMPGPGTHTLSAVDSLGRTDSVEVHVKRLAR